MADISVNCTYKYLAKLSSHCETEIKMEIYLAPREHPTPWRIHVAPLSLCKGLHTVTWVVVGTSVTLKDFDFTGELPSGVKPVTWPPIPGPGEGEWTAVIDTTGVEEIGGFGYHFNFNLSGTSETLLSSRSFICDPTIAVTPDPVEVPVGCPPPMGSVGVAQENV